MQLPEWLRSQDNKSAIKPHRTAHSAGLQPPVTTSALRHPLGVPARKQPISHFPPPFPIFHPVRGLDADVNDRQ